MNVVRAVIFKLFSALLFATMAVLVRYVGETFPVGQVVFFLVGRFLVGGIISCIASVFQDLLGGFLLCGKHELFSGVYNPVSR